VFLSYASQDREAARILGDALPGYGLEVWYDESELGGGDAWDQKIRRQIRECDYFMPLVSAQTEARHEGYFRREWRLAVERTLDMADDHLFLLPVVIDDTVEARARVPDKFLAVQWLKVPGGRPTAALESMCRRIAASAGRPIASAPVRGVAPATPPVPSTAIPQFPREEPGQRVRFWFEVIGWSLRTGWLQLRRLPRVLRVLAFIWLGLILLDRGCSSGRHVTVRTPALDELRSLANEYHGSADSADVARLAEKVARDFSKEGVKAAAARNAVLAVPFIAPAADAAAERIVDSTFAQLYGRIAVAHHGQIGLPATPVRTCELAALIEQGSAQDAQFVLCGAVRGEAPEQSLVVTLAKVADHSIGWSKSYPLAGADPAQVAAEIAAQVPAPDED
jgi:hypothetical protein